MKQQKPEEKPKNGAMQMDFGTGKMRMFMDGEWKDFGIAYVTADMRQIARSPKLHRSPYIWKIRKWANELDLGGMFSIPMVQAKLKAFWGASEQWMAHDCRVWCDWLQQIRQIRIGKKDAPPQKESNKKFREGYDTIFKKVA